MFRTTMVSHYVKAMAEYGLAEADLLADTGVDRATLSSADALITLDQYQAVIANMYRLSGDSALAFSLGRSIRLSDFGLVGYAMISARTMRQATEVWCKYSNSLVGQYTETSWDDSKTDHEVIYRSPAERGMLHRFETEISIVRGINVVRDLTGAAPVYRSISLAYPEPPHRALYDEVMQCPLEFDAPQTVLRLIGRGYDTPIKTTNDELFTLCAEHCGKVMKLLPDSDMLLNRLRNLFLSRPAQLPDINDASEQLGMSVSTLLRKLEASGQSYQGVKDQFRLELAQEYLRSGHMSAKQVAYLLGFNSPSNFSRAFKAWSGRTVGEFLREEAR